MQDESQSACGIGRVQRHVSRAGLEHAQHADYQLARSWQAQGDERLRSYAERSQVASQLVGFSIELRVGQLPIVADDRHRVGTLPDLLLDQLMQAFIRRPVYAGVVPLQQQLPPLGFAQQREIGDLSPGVFNDRLH